MRGGPGADRETGLRGGPCGREGYRDILKYGGGILPEGVHGEKGGISRLRHGYNRNANKCLGKILAKQCKKLYFSSLFELASGLFA